jgi:hypothetical protein
MQPTRWAQTGLLISTAFAAFVLNTCDGNRRSPTEPVSQDLVGTWEGTLQAVSITPPDGCGQDLLRASYGSPRPMSLTVLAWISELGRAEGSLGIPDGGGGYFAIHQNGTTVTWAPLRWHPNCRWGIFECADGAIASVCQHSPSFAGTAVNDRMRGDFTSQYWVGDSRHRESLIIVVHAIDLRKVS